MDYLIRFVQNHESFRQPELEALSTLNKIHTETLTYSPTSPFSTIRLHHSKLPSSKAAHQLISRSVLSKGIYELWGRGTSYDELHADVKQRSWYLWARYKDVSFRFFMDSFCGKRSSTEQTAIFNAFRYLGFEGKIDLKAPAEVWVVFEEWEDVKGKLDNAGLRYGVVGDTVDLSQTASSRKPRTLFFGRKIGSSSRSLIEKHDLKQRPYISTTSMDAELALVTATLALAAPGKLFLDPFVGTGGFLVAAAELGAVTLGSDIDGRSFKGKSATLEKGIGANFTKYGLTDLYGDCIISDLIHTPYRCGSHRPCPDPLPDVNGLASSEKPSSGRWLDGIICDPPYGVREGLKSLGLRTNQDQILPVAMLKGVPAHTIEGYIAPKKPYSFIKMLDDILNFAAQTLVDDGRLAFWMPTANDEEDIGIPEHQALELVHCCVQAFNKWSRRLLVYRRKVKFEWHKPVHDGPARLLNGTNADELNPFRRKYFQGFGVT